MPNWVSNTLRVKAKTEQELDAFLDAVNAHNDPTQQSFKSEYSSFDFNFNAIVPQPSNLFLDNLGAKEREMCKELNIPNWYDWNTDNWGTKWNACHTDLSHQSKKECTITFDTAWSFPTPVIYKMYEMFPHLKFNIFAIEESHDFALEIDSKMRVRDLEPLYYVYDESYEKIYLHWDSDNYTWADDNGVEYDEYEDVEYAPKRLSRKL